MALLKQLKNQKRKKKKRKMFNENRIRYFFYLNLFKFVRFLKVWIDKAYIYFHVKAFYGQVICPNNVYQRLTEKHPEKHPNLTVSKIGHLDVSTEDLKKSKKIKKDILEVLFEGRKEA